MRPEYLIQGEPARLFPVLATTSKEGRTTSILLACLSKIDEFTRELLRPIGVSMGKRASVECWTEIVFKNESKGIKDRPDGLIIVRNGKKEWRCLVEAKVGIAELTSDQIEKYRNLAKENGIDCVLTISNQFATRVDHHPIEAVRKTRSKIPIFHWSWMFVLTSADLLIKTNSIEDRDQYLLLEELRRFLTHDSAGVKGFDSMPPEWVELNKQVSAGSKISTKSEIAQSVLIAWHQETKDLSLILSRLTEAAVSERLSRKHAADPSLRIADELQHLKEQCKLETWLDIPNAAAPLEIVADITRRTVEVSMSISAPKDKQSSKARLNWLLRQFREKVPDDLHIRFIWPGRSENNHADFKSLKEDPSIIEVNKNGSQVLGFQIFISRRLSSRFTQRKNFISDLEEIVPEFYREVGQFIVPWREKAPQIKSQRNEASDVTVQALEEESEANAVSGNDNSA
ncbi:hypothetical protein FMN63_01995 [Stappia sp. BW2]|uniref:hypothetical protein n=1 Tax=Stappia sp. BW2 TaxID=2592622 RepID=UPI0011DEABEC|nr:hypothetical protein [Stappia sp. BW2]TYC80037.1 hypothetical protein FMN63_01995 [Stappia sp. BW2]